MDVFKNQISASAAKKAIKKRNNYAKKFNHDENARYPLSAHVNDKIGSFIGVKNIVAEEGGEPINPQNGIVIGNIRMGYGHYRIAMAIASAAHSMGITPYWFDLLSFENTTGQKIIGYLNKMYSLASRLSRKSIILNWLFERETAGVHKTLIANAEFNEMNKLMVPVYRSLPKTMPFIGAHSWPAQAAIHAGMKNVVNVIPDNWPLGLHLSEGALHTIQSTSAYIGYRTLKGMDKTKEVLNPMPEGSIRFTGHYVDHELVSNIDYDCDNRMDRVRNKKARRLLMTIGGAGAEGKTYLGLIDSIIPQIKEGKVKVCINTGDHKEVFEMIKKELAGRDLSFDSYTEWEDIVRAANSAITEDLPELTLFHNPDIFAAVYTTNLLMRSADILIAKPSEFSYYPIPKLFVKRVGGHEAWGAIRSSELGDGTIECENMEYARQVLNLMINEDDILTMQCEAIKKLHTLGMYNGAYNVVKLAIGEKI